MGLFRCLEAHSAKEAIGIIESPPRLIHAICSDWKMPLIDGAALLHAANEIAPTIRRYMFTGMIDEEKLTTVKSDDVIERVFLKSLDPFAVIKAIREDKKRLTIISRFFHP